MTLRAGIASAIITPPIGTAMEGYSAREGGSNGVHDDLHARALMLDDGSTTVALVACDLLGVDRRLVSEARHFATDATDIDPSKILIAGTHTHAGPAGLRRDTDDALMDVIARHISGAIAAAQRALRPAVLKVGTTTVDSVAQNRRDPNGPVDTTLRVLLFDDPDPLRPPVAALINFACHPTVLYHTNMQLSADYVGASVRTLERVYPGLGALQFNGACGDVNPAWIKQDFPEVERVGAVVGSAAAKLIGELRPLGPGQKSHNIRWDEHLDQPVTAGELVEDVRLRAASRNVDLPIKSFLSKDEYAASLRELDARAAAASLQEEHRRVMAQVTRLRTEVTVAARMAGRSGQLLHPELMAVSFGPDVALLGLPGEWFVETIAGIRERVGLRHLPVACYANHYIGYVVPAHAYDEGGYEPGVTFLAPEAESIAKDAAIGLVREVGR